jgi:hypothetical protein
MNIVSLISIGPNTFSQLVDMQQHNFPTSYKEVYNLAIREPSLHELLGHVEKLAPLLADGFQLILDTLVLLLQLLDLCLDLSFKGQLVLL